MAMTNEEYWAQRAEERELAWHKKSQETIELELAKAYRDALGKIQTEIAALYGRYAKDNQLTIADARKLLMGAEYRTWRMGLQQYVAMIQKTNDKGLLRELNTLAMRSRISRLDKLYSDTLMVLDALGRDTIGQMDHFLTDAYKDNYYHGLYDIGQKWKIVQPVAKVDSTDVEQVLRTPWSGKNYSERVWKNTSKLGDLLQDQMVTAIHRGESVQKISRLVMQRMDVGKNNATRLVRTELNYVQNKAAIDSIAESGMKYYTFIATLDRRTSQICRAHDRRVYPVQEAQPGTNMPPLHPNCRSTISGSLSDNTDGSGIRIAKNGSNKSIHVPANMTYDDWQAIYVEKTMTLTQWKRGNT
jgi:SPP1 gp7 family putative phage head morphogenesis protein